MSARLAIVVVFVFVAGPAVPVLAQIPVTDAAHLTQAVLIAQRVQRHLDELRAQYRTIMRMSQGLGAMEHYRMPPVGIVRHDASRWTYGGTWLRALNSGDPAGTAYFASAVPLERPDVPSSGMTAAARRTLERQYATIEVSDSVAMMAGHQVGALRGYQDQLQGAVREHRGAAGHVTGVRVGAQADAAGEHGRDDPAGQQQPGPSRACRPGACRS